MAVVGEAFYGTSVLLYGNMLLEYKVNLILFIHDERCALHYALDSYTDDPALQHRSSKIVVRELRHFHDQVLTIVLLQTCQNFRRAVRN